LYTIISHHSGQTFDKVHKDSERDYWMSWRSKRIRNDWWSFEKRIKIVTSLRFKV
jgi:hypothetical protein